MKNSFKAALLAPLFAGCATTVQTAPPAAPQAPSAPEAVATPVRAECMDVSHRGGVAKTLVLPVTVSAGDFVSIKQGDRPENIRGWVPMHAVNAIFPAPASCDFADANSVRSLYGYGGSEKTIALQQSVYVPQLFDVKCDNAGAFRAQFLLVDTDKGAPVLRYSPPDTDNGPLQTVPLKKGESCKITAAAPRPQGR